MTDLIVSLEVLDGKCEISFALHHLQYYREAEIIQPLNQQTQNLIF